MALKRRTKTRTNTRKRTKTRTKTPATREKKPALFPMLSGGTVGILAACAIGTAMVVAAAASRRPVPLAEEEFVAEVSRELIDAPAPRPIALAEAPARRPTPARIPAAHAVPIPAVAVSTAPAPDIDVEVVDVEPEVALPAAIAAAPASAVTVTGCLERDADRFRLKDTSGGPLPKARSWKSGFLRKRAPAIDVVDVGNRLRLASYVGERVSMTGTLADREMQALTLQRVSASCD